MPDLERLRVQNEGPKYDVKGLALPVEDTRYLAFGLRHSVLSEIRSYLSVFRPLPSVIWPLFYDF